MKKTILAVLTLFWCLAAFAKTHTVVRGESLYSIAQSYNITVEQLTAANPGAEKLFYVGLKLNIPEQTANTPTTEQPKSAQPTQPIQQTASTSFQSEQDNEVSDPFEDERKSGVFEISYQATSFDEAKITGSYGVSWMALPWKIAPKFYAGVHLSPFNFNFGLVDSHAASDLIKFGPAIGYYFSPKTFIAMPLDVNCLVYFKDSKEEGSVATKSETKTAWGISASPAIYIGSKAGIFFGPQITIGFSKGSKTEFGFRAGIYF